MSKRLRNKIVSMIERNPIEFKDFDQTPKNVILDLFDSLKTESCEDDVIANACFERIGDLFYIIKTSNDFENDYQQWIDDNEKAKKFQPSTLVEKRQKTMINDIISRAEKPRAIKGIHVCKNGKCRNDEFYCWQLQTRSSDEPMTQYRRCTKCDKVYKE